MKAFVETYGSDVIHAWAHDRDEPHRFAVDGNRADGGAGAGAALDPEAEAGPAALHGRHEDYRRRGQRPRTTADLRPAEGEGDGDRPQLLQGRRRLSLRLGWLVRHGDVATIDEHGFMNITDRAKDVIKSGGEWISSIDLENIAVGCPACWRRRPSAAASQMGRAAASGSGQGNPAPQ